MKKQLTIVLIILTLILSLIACSKSTPTSAVERDLNKIKELSLDKETMKQFGLSDYEDMDLAGFEPFITKVQEFDYEIGEEVIDGEKATVKVTITTYNFGKAMDDFFMELVSLALLNPDISEEELTKEFVDAMLEPQTKDYTKEVTVNCTLKDGEWETDIMENDEVLDAILGGLITSIEELDNLFSE